MSLDVRFGDLPVQQSLGQAWNIKSDSFTNRICSPVKPFTRRGPFSVDNSLFDPLGFISPIVPHGRILYREIGECSNNWDYPLPEGQEKELIEW